MGRETWRLVASVGLFALAMGYMESAVVVYLRTIYYPEGFSFPLKTLDPAIGLTELIREAATMVMLLGVAFIAAKRTIIRFAFFIFAFAVWDIFYYVFLWLLIGWPSSLLEWDILFLIPVAWVGPVIAPVVNSLTMTGLAFLIVVADARSANARLSAWEWTLLIAGSLITIGAYVSDYLAFNIKTGGPRITTGVTPDYIPQHFNWFLFAAGEVLFFIALYIFWKRELKRVTGDA